MLAFKLLLYNTYYLNNINQRRQIKFGAVIQINIMNNKKNNVF